jgi:hypothetical protein
MHFGLKPLIWQQTTISLIMYMAMFRIFLYFFNMKVCGILCVIIKPLCIVQIFIIQHKIGIFMKIKLKKLNLIKIECVVYIHIEGKKTIISFEESLQIKHSRHFHICICTQDICHFNVLKSLIAHFSFSTIYNNFASH